MSGKNYTRREAIKYGAKVAAGATIWGAVGNIAGKVYDNTVRPIADKVEEGYEGLRKLNPFKKKEPEPVTRRGFLRTLAGAAHQHPVAAGTLVGAAYGAGKYAISGLSKYLTQRQMAILKDENTDYRERIRVLEGYKEKLETGMKEKEIDDRKTEVELEKELINVRGMLGELEKPSRLEKKVSEEEPSTPGEIPIIIGASGILVSIILSSASITGNAVGNMNPVQTNLIDTVIFMVSVFLIFIGILYKRISKSS